MSDIGLKQGELKPGADQHAPRGSAGLAVLLALFAAAIAAALVYSVRAAFDPAVMIVLGGLAFVGLFGLLAAIGGLVRFGRSAGRSKLATQVLDQFADACLVTDQRGRVAFSNQAYRELTGTKHAKRPVSIEKLYAAYPDISEPVYRLTQSSLDGGAREEEIRILAGSAAAGARPESNAWLRIAVSPIDVREGKTLTLWRIADVTAEREQQENAFNQLQQIIDYLDHAPAGFFSADQEHRIQYINATLAEWLKIDLTQTTGGKLAIKDIVSDADVKRLLAGGRDSDAEGERVDLDLLTSAGVPVPVQVVHRSDVNAAGEVLGSRSLVLKRAGPDAVSPDGGEDLAFRFDAFFAHAPVAIAEVDDTGLIEHANRRFTALFGGAAAAGGNLKDLVGEEAAEALATRLRDAAAGHSSSAPVEAVLSDNGAVDNGSLEKRTSSLFLSPVGRSGEAVRLLVYAVDTTEQKALELQFAQSQKMQAVGQLAGGVAHDFNNVLTAIIGFSDLLLARHRPTDPSFQDIMNIKQNANRAANLVRQLLAFSRRQTLRPEVLSLSDVLSDLGNLLNRLLGEKVSLTTEHGRELGLVKVDINQFEQVIINLAVNARDAMPAGGELKVSTANVSEAESQSLGHDVMPKGEYVLCEISDTGTGMPPEVLAKIYEPFFSTKEVGKGTGLGLSTVYGIVKQTGGFIFADSQESVGTTFRIYLPRHYPDESEVRELEEVKPEAKTDLTGAGTILLVEDEDAVRAFASRALASRGYTVMEAASGQAALDLVDGHEGDIDLVISDVVMPEMDGPTLLKELRGRRDDINIVFISGYAEDAFRKNLGENERFAFLPKPFSLKQLAAAVKNALEEGAK